MYLMYIYSKGFSKIIKINTHSARMHSIVKADKREVETDKLFLFQINAFF